MLPVTPFQVLRTGGLKFDLFNFSNEADFESFISQAIVYADAWMQGHLGQNYNLLIPSWAAALQEQGQIFLALESLSATLKSLKTQGTHYPYAQEESPAFQTLIDQDWGERALVALDLWTTVEVGAARSFALPLLVEASGMNAADKLRDSSFPGMSSQYSSELDFSRDLVVPDVGTVRR